MQQDILTIAAGRLDDGNYIYGIADLTGLLTGQYASFNRAVSIARKLDDRIIDAIVSGPTMEYFDHYHGINDELNRASAAVQDDLRRAGTESLAVQATMTDTRIDGDFSQTLRAALSHKMAATRAGLGWIGKTDLFISRKWGPRVRLATVLFRGSQASTDRPVEKSRCGNCRICVDACPAGAATGALWDTTTDRNVFFDPFKCRDHCRRISAQRLERQISLCGICVSVCPVGEKETFRREDSHG